MRGPNMSYCAFENTLEALYQVRNIMYAAQDDGMSFDEFLASRSSAEERLSVERLISIVTELKESADEWMNTDEDGGE